MSNWTLTLHAPTRGDAQRRSLRRPGSFAVRMLDRVFLWMERAQDRHRLEQLDPHLLKDIGLTRADVAREASKPFWEE